MSDDEALRSALARASARRADPPGQLPFQMQQPPGGLSQAEIDALRGAAYGTPHEPFIKDASSASRFLHSLSSPALNYGLDMSRVTTYPEKGPASVRRLGFYDPKTDRGEALEFEDASPGSVGTHEDMHRSYTRLADDLLAKRGWGLLTYPSMQHALMDQEEAALGGRGRTRLVGQGQLGVHGPVGDLLERLNRDITAERRERGDFGRFGPR